MPWTLIPEKMIIMPQVSDINRTCQPHVSQTSSPCLGTGTNLTTQAAEST